jgi:hypothetical protein
MELLPARMAGPLCCAVPRSKGVKVANPWFGVGVTAEVYLLCSNMFFDHVGFFSRCSCNY